MSGPTFFRRRNRVTVVIGLLAVVLASCSSPTALPENANQTAAASSPPSSAPSPSPSPSAPPPPPTAEPSSPSSTSAVAPTPAAAAAQQRSPVTSIWQPGPGEVQPEIKQAAAAFIETAGTWTNGAGAVASLSAVGTPAAVARTASALEAPGALASTVHVVYPQYGGIAPDRAAVMVLFDQTLQNSAGSMTSREQLLDVRLVRQGAGGWTVERVNPLTSLGPAQGLSATARAVLASPRLQLPAPARADVSSGRMDDRLLRVMLDLSSSYVLTVDVLHTGHIQTVYPTERVSNHAVGRAVDIRAIDGSPVVDPATSRELLTQVMVRAAELGATEVGGPFDLNGPKPGYFSDAVHQDHLHLGITPGKPPASR